MGCTAVSCEMAGIACSHAATRNAVAEIVRIDSASVAELSCLSSGVENYTRLYFAGCPVGYCCVCAGCGFCVPAAAGIAVLVVIPSGGITVIVLSSHSRSTVLGIRSCFFGAIDSGCSFLSFDVAGVVMGCVICS